ncbi:MAG: hypothetical protein GWO24_27845 [Akkermansiaceae bacterium]|nr:hypothetical protein [Akkermansiaceae bacterium]
MIRQELAPHVRNWMFAGPYRMTGRGEELHNEAFPPETERVDVPWQRFTYNYGTRIHQFPGHTEVDLCTGYLKTTLVSPSAREVRLEMTSDDSIKARLNGKLIHDNPSRRSLGEWDRVKVPLQKGRNELLLKISNHEGKWGLGCRVLTPDGQPVEGLKVIAEE